MALKIKFAGSTSRDHVKTLVLRIALGFCAAVLLIGISVFAFFYIKYQGIVDERLKQPIFANTAKIYAAPHEVRPGQKLTVNWIANQLREAGYTGEAVSPASPLGTYNQGVQAITVRPGAESYHAPDSATIHVSGGQVDTITDANGQALSSYELEPLLITGLS